MDVVINYRRFQSTPSAWRETTPERSTSQAAGISIHSLRMEGDPIGKAVATAFAVFQSTPSAWRETSFKPPQCRNHSISIHSLRMEGDCKDLTIYNVTTHFNPLPPHGGRQRHCGTEFSHKPFQSTPSAWRETLIPTMQKYNGVTFQSTPSAWRETGVVVFEILKMVPFQSTPSAWRETTLILWRASVGKSFQSTPSAWRETQLEILKWLSIVFQSTPSAWRETGGYFSMAWNNIISIHSLRMEGDLHAVENAINLIPFQSTPSAWRETNRLKYNFTIFGISIHSLRMEGDLFVQFRGQRGSISIHSLRMEGDLQGSDNLQRNDTFQSTPSAWRETWKMPVSRVHSRYFNPLPPHGGRPVCEFINCFQSGISIHSLRMEGDRKYACSFFVTIRISIHSLRMEGDRGKGRNGCVEQRFQSTPSAWRETLTPHNWGVIFSISIHSLRMEGDLRTTVEPQKPEHFNPLPPHGGRPSKRSRCCTTEHFNPLPPHGGRQICNSIWCGFIVISIHSLRMEGDSMLKCGSLISGISIHSLRMEGDRCRRLLKLL